MKKKVEEKKENKLKWFFIKILISITLGFLPSFLFVAFFVQYGSLFSNYFKFLFDFSSSWRAWISAVLITFLTFIGMNIIKSKKDFKKNIKNKFFLFMFILLVLVILLLIFAQLYLYANFVLGNDILVKLSSDKDNLFFENNLDEEITFKISVVMNPFCTAQCEYNFFDISKGEEIELGIFNTLSILSKSKSYTFSKDELAQGQILNRFEVSCKSKKTILCYTRERESRRSVLISLNYELNEEDKKFKNESKEEIIFLGEKILSVERNLNESKSNLNLINSSFFIEDFSKQLEGLSSSFLQLNQSFENLKELWEIQNFISLREELSSFYNESEELNLEAEELNLNIISNISFYNNLIENITNSKTILYENSQINLTDSLCERLNNLIVYFNGMVQQFETELNLLEKSKIVETLSFEVGGFYDEIQNFVPESEITSSCFLNESFINLNLEKIERTFVDDISFTIFLEEPAPICCFLGKCEKCCDEECSDENYPIIFLHGHNINKALPVDYSFDSFAEIKQKLIDEDYIDAGVMVMSSLPESKGILGKVNTSIMMTASYFFDTYKEEGKEVTVLSKNEGMDTYAIRLNNIIEIVKHRTNKDKVILIAQSMGGLVARRYIQIFGGEDVDKAIYVTVPNHGVEGKVKDFCALIGPEIVCKELGKDSLLINKLNNAPTDIIPTYNIVGIGCNMGEDTGDGVIKNSSQYLDYATNYYVNGTCNELDFEFFHETILYPHRYPEAYEIIKQILKEN